MEQLKAMKEQLTSLVQGQLSNVSDVDTKELGEAVDMIKDLAEAVYYCTVTEAMEEGKKQEKTMYYTPVRMTPDYYRDMDREWGKMYYGSSSSGYDTSGAVTTSGGGANSRNYNSRYPVMPMEDYENRYSRMSRDNYDSAYPMTVRDYREGNSPMKRKMYMESKEMHKDMASKMKDLESYSQELTKDVVGMIADATPEEKTLLKQKIEALAAKI